MNSLSPGAIQSLVGYQARLARRNLRRIRQLLRHGRMDFGGAPVLFANSFPKSGTHLLTQALQGLPSISLSVDGGLPAVVTYQGESGAARPVTAILRDLRRFLPGDIGYGHLHAIPEVVAFLSQPTYATYFILRDPRDVVVSHVHYVTDMEPRHALHRYYNESLHSFSERLRASILGLPEIGFSFPNIRQRLEPYLGWIIIAPAGLRPVLTLRFEDFRADPPGVLGQVIDHAVQHGLALKPGRSAAIDHLLSVLNPQRSPTFRSGKTGGWREAFSEEHKELFKQVSGDLLLQLGYEDDLAW